MEILSLLRLTAWRVVGLIVIAAVAGAVTVNAVLARPARYEATATVFVSRAMSSGASVFDIGPLLADFQTQLTLLDTRQAASDAAGVPVGELQIASVSSGDGTTVQVIAQGDGAQETATVVETISRTAIESLAANTLERANEIQASREVAVAGATARKLEFESELEFVNPSAKYEDIQNEITALELEDPVANAAAIRDLEARLPELAQARAEYEAIQSDLDQAQAALEEATQARIEANAVADLVQGDSVLVVDEPAELSKAPLAVQAAVASTVAVAAVGIALFWIYDSATGKRVREEEEAEAAELAAARMGRPQVPMQMPNQAPAGYTDPLLADTGPPPQPVDDRQASLFAEANGGNGSHGDGNGTPAGASPPRSVPRRAQPVRAAPRPPVVTDAGRRSRPPQPDDGNGEKNGAPAEDDAAESSKGNGNDQGRRGRRRMQPPKPASSDAEDSAAAEGDDAADGSRRSRPRPPANKS
ncbi:MAG: hypothetical protein S0880_02655 [Actinomycetota bacterium]|nr:hypothetical protein [Actinomycetota bacterium]